MKFRRLSYFIIIEVKNIKYKIKNWRNEHFLKEIINSEGCVKIENIKTRKHNEDIRNEKFKKDIWKEKDWK